MIPKNNGEQTMSKGESNVCCFIQKLDGQSYEARGTEDSYS